MSTAVLEVQDLTVDFLSGPDRVRAVRGIGFELHPGERVALVGESGCGKSATVTAVLGLLRPNARVGGQIWFGGRDLRTARPRAWRAVRGRGIALVPQDPLAALNPVRTIGSVLSEVIGLPGRLPAAGRRRRALEVLADVGLGEPERVLRSYPSQLSGGQRQRVVIALAIVNRPAVVLADEPTTALDVTVQARVLDTLTRVTQDLGAALLLVSHDLAVVAGHTDRTLVMYAGRIVEAGPTAEVLGNPAMPYTRGLVAAHPCVHSDALVRPIPGDPPDPVTRWAGCSFAPRCPVVLPVCRSGAEPGLVVVGPGHSGACVRLEPPR